MRHVASLGVISGLIIKVAHLSCRKSRKEGIRVRSFTESVRVHAPLAPTALLSRGLDRGHQMPASMLPRGAPTWEIEVIRQRRGLSTRDWEGVKGRGGHTVLGRGSRVHIHVWPPGRRQVRAVGRGPLGRGIATALHGNFMGLTLWINNAVSSHEVGYILVLCSDCL